MRTTRAKPGFLRVLSLSCFIYLLWSACTGVVADRRVASHQPTLKRSRRSYQSAKHKGAHHRPLTDEQKADQNLQFMLSLYRSAAEPDGRPKQHRKFGSNTVRLLKPCASSVHYLPASGDHCYTFTVQYNLDTLPSEQLVRASFIHLRSSPSSSPGLPSAAQAAEPPRCRAQITSLGAKTLVTLEPHEQWTETDITAHISGHFLQGKGGGDEAGHLTLTAQYWCADAEHPAAAAADDGRPWWLPRLAGRKQWSGEPHLELPSLLLYLEEDREVKDWMGDLLGAEGESIMMQIGRWHPSARRRRSQDSTSPEPKDSSLDALKNAPSSSSSFSTSHSASIISDIPALKHKAGAPKNRCKLHSFRLSFDELGWGHYFIAPPVYNPRFCQGDCPRVLHYGYHSPNHAIIQTAINDLGLGDVPPPSCVPYKYMPMSVLVVHKKKVEYRELEDMVAESCTCR
ncbi:bone morphogenetic protein 15 [Salarias fasciatus]|uniref:TGF-beta family profile domain-containing protein n=1 Tax=Salarias fasciatus TaxID=181472 RepID=A0A672ICF3_SALFA|nr:bone morphogenetic protein 15 [Salarias fasciatus]